MGKIRILKEDPDCDLEKSVMEFRLTYSGQLFGASRTDTRASHKHEIRKVFHKQLKKLWEIDPFLNENFYYDFDMNKTTLIENRSRNFNRSSFNFVPLIVRNDPFVCDIKILFIRTDAPGKLVESGDLDNRLKTIFDALRMPNNRDEMGGYEPAEDEIPFFCLLEDDRLITHVSIETDTLLEPINSDEIKVNDARLIIHVHIRPFKVNLTNINFL
jgi:hypothetical protein